ncbi:Dipeptide transport system permease protein DppC (TC 3.A.1.5.2) [hydrothermal vent metagenome]|uniref:Dipeptide transport system permease protein DppC (TC 3.A.1.5.2) n=1 Tax=hydrothermal vent metagenome TaxID=652676 RepID=A0A3B1C9K8_9ZZZZ
MRYGNISFIIGVTLTAGFVLVALFAPFIAPYSPYEQDFYNGLAGPGALHLLGQDSLGRDILSRIIYGARVSLLVGFVTVFISATVGVALGSVAGYFGGRMDEVIMRISDIFLSFPGILLAIAVMAVRGPGLENVIVALSIMGWTGYARLARGQALSLREREFVLAAEALGAGPLRIIFLHLLPNIAAPLIVEVTFGVAAAIVGEAGLSFLGLGAQPPTASWGSMLSEGRSFLLIAPHLTTFPGIAIMLVVMGINFLGDSLRTTLDPKSERTIKAI